MNGNGYRNVSGSVFGLIAVGHGIRAVMQLPAQLGSMVIPVWISWIGAVAAGALCAWAFRPRPAS